MIRLEKLRCCAASKVGEGSLIRLGSDWWLRVLAERGVTKRPATLLLTGPQAGRLRDATDDEGLEVPIATWFPAVSALAAMDLDVHSTASLHLGVSGLTIWGSFASGHEHCFDLSGKDVSQTDGANFLSPMKFGEWDCYYQPDGLIAPVKLFSVSRIVPK